jgi:hypothetical protein
MGTCYPNFERKRLLLLLFLHEFLAFEREATSVDFADVIFFFHSEVKIHYTTHMMNVVFMYTGFKSQVSK